MDTKAVLPAILCRRKGKKPSSLPGDSRVRFILGPGPDDYLDCWIDGGELYINAISGPMAIIPHAANEISLKRIR